MDKHREERVLEREYGGGEGRGGKGSFTYWVSRPFSSRRRIRSGGIGSAGLRKRR